jgi:hypothetical protein
MNTMNIYITNTISIIALSIYSIALCCCPTSLHTVFMKSSRTSILNFAIYKSSFVIETLDSTLKKLSACHKTSLLTLEAFLLRMMLHPCEIYEKEMVRNVDKERDQDPIHIISSSKHPAFLIQFNSPIKFFCIKVKSRRLTQVMHSL